MTADTDMPASAAKERVKRSWTIGRIALWCLIILFILVLIVSCILWVNRYPILERAAKTVLRDQGITADFSLKSITRTNLSIKDVSLSADGETFFSAKEVKAKYAWRDALDGDIKRLEFDGPTAQVTIDKNGKIIDGWLPPQNPDSQGFAVPPEGVFLNDGTLFLKSPYGTVNAMINADFQSYEDFDAAFEISPTTLQINDVALTGGGSVDVKLRNNDPSIKLDVDLSELNNVKGRAENLRIRGQFVPDIQDRSLAIEGPLSFDFDRVTTPEFDMGAGKATWSGRAISDKPAPKNVQAVGDWTLDLKAVKLVKTDRRKNLAESLTLYKTLSAAPVSGDFALELTKTVERILTQSDVMGAGTLDFASDGYDISLSAPLVLKAPMATATVSPVSGFSAYVFDRPTENLSLHFSAALTGSRAVKLENAALDAKSSDGLSLNGVEAFTAKAIIPAAWVSKTKTGRATRLEPLSTNVSYKTDGNRRLLNLYGAVNYDGDLPGGYVTNLKTSGHLDVSIVGNTLSTRFKPRPQTPITMTRVDTTVGWYGENLSFGLTSDTPFFVRGGDGSTIDVTLSDVTGLLADDIESKHFDLAAQNLLAKGTLENGRQDWTLTGSDVHIQSDDVPGPGTDVKAASATLTAHLEPEQPVEFTMESPSADILSRLVNANHLKVAARGTPDDFTLDFSQGDIKFAADAIPSLPMQGVVNFNAGVWDGEAETFLPKAEDSPIDVVFRFEDGVGTGKILIPEIAFRPKGFQPQSLVPALRGKVSRVEGIASAELDISFGADQPLKSSGTVQLKDMDVGTLPGPFTGINTTVELSSIFPLQTVGRQTMTVKLFDPGMPLENGTIDYELVPNGVKLHAASWPMGEGKISVDPTTWDFGKQENRIALRVNGVSLGMFVRDIGGGKVNATGDVVGLLPVVISGVNVNVENGVLSVPNGGVIQFATAQTNAVADQNQFTEMAFEALKDFQYDKLEATMNGPLDGDIALFMEFKGKNPNVLYGTEFLFRVNIEGELVNIARSLKPGADTLSRAKQLISK